MVDTRKGSRGESPPWINLTEILYKISKCCKNAKKNQDRLLLLVDLKKAYDNVIRDKLFHILQNRATNEVDHYLAYLIEQLYKDQTIIVGEETVPTQLGLAQGGVLIPELFNIYLHEALVSKQTIRSLIQEEKLSAFADDIICDLWGRHRTKQVIQEFESLE